MYQTTSLLITHLIRRSPTLVGATAWEPWAMFPLPMGAALRLPWGTFSGRLTMNFMCRLSSHDHRVFTIYNIEYRVYSIYISVLIRCQQTIFYLILHWLVSLYSIMHSPISAVAQYLALLHSHFTFLNSDNSILEENWHCKSIVESSNSYICLATHCVFFQQTVDI